MADGDPIIDLHSHVLPGLDDGAADAQDALTMLRIAAADGITVIAATPHAAHAKPEQIVGAVAALNTSATREGLPVRIVPGSEIMFAADLADRYRHRRLTPLNDTRYLLIELPLHADWSPFFPEAIFALQVAGALPILAHVERYRAVQQRPAILADAIAAGVLIQVNAPSILGHAGRTARTTADRLLRQRMVHLVASDAHNTTTRPPRVRAALTRVSDIVDADYAAWIRANAARVLTGEAVTEPAPARAPRSSWSDWRRRR